MAEAPTTHDKLLGSYLKDRRAKLDPAALGFPLNRRRTPGLRREEVAQRAHVSATWYTWLEQGRGGAPSAAVLERIAGALMLTEAERQHLFLLGLGRPPEVRVQPPSAVSPRLQRLLDALPHSPAYLKTATWDILAWNHAATRVLTDYGLLPPERRNLLRLLFTSPTRPKMPNWRDDARFVVAAFRADIARAGLAASAQPLVEELCRHSAEFAVLWQTQEVRDTYGEVAKQVHHPLLGRIALEYSSFAVDGRCDLALVVYNPATPDDLARVRQLVDAPGPGG